MSIRQRCVVWVPRQPDDPEGRLPAAEAADMLGGGERSLHEIAVALAAAGHAVELRGNVHRGELAALTDAAGVDVELPREPRVIGPGDVVIAPEGIDDPLVWSKLVLSGARTVLALLAPPGVFGWDLGAAWGAARLRAATALGLELWTHMPRLAAEAQAAGVRCEMIGTGRPMPYPEPAPKRYDVGTFARNRWSADARAVADRLGPDVTRLVVEGTNDEVLEQLGQTRVLIHPMRLEGHSRIGCEARAMGAVVVTLDDNSYAVGIGEDTGAVAVASLDEMPATVEALLSDPGRLEALRDRAMRTAREQIDWDSYVRRVDAALAREGDDPARAARGQIGERIRDHDNDARERERTLAAAAGELRERVEMLHREVAVRDRLVSELEPALHEARSAAWHREQELETVKLERERLQISVRDAQQTVDMIRSTRIWRTAMAWYRVRGRFGGSHTP